MKLKEKNRIPAEIGLSYCTQLFQRILNELSPEDHRLTRLKLEAPVWERFWSWLCWQKYLQYWLDLQALAGIEASVQDSLLLNESLSGILPESEPVKAPIWKLTLDFTASLPSQSTDPVVKGSRMNSVLLAPLIIGEPTVPAFHKQLELLISWDSGMVTGHFRYLHKNVVKCSHLSMKCIVFQSKLLASSYLPL